MDNCKTINIFLHPSSCLQPVVPLSGKLHGAEKKKTPTIFLIISVFLCVSGNVFPVPSGAGRSRTAVQTVNRCAFYMLIRWLVVGAAPDVGTQGRPYPLLLSPACRGVAPAIPSLPAPPGQQPTVGAAGRCLVPAPCAGIKPNLLCFG